MSLVRKCPPCPCEGPRVVCKYVRMPQQQSPVDSFFQNGNDGHQEFSVVLRGYERNQVDGALQRLTQQLQQAALARDEAESRLNEAQRRIRQAEQRLSSVEQKLTDT